ncbi:hypothetical protein [Clostridium sardiniense]|uniref:hypothetical protein n=1 Tax=Clostridium sardiniense TaxID=29369 RepID=UPI00195A89AC|nr:hypothetical protein [Clostridium sardiniense]MBM7833229.1 hypothetical protein [Clostridium sardiniense]
MSYKKEKRIKTPWHLWFVAILFIFIYTNGVYDYFMMLGHNMDYYNSKGYGDTVVQYFTNYLTPFLILYTMNIFAGILAPILLLLRKKVATYVALISAVSDTLLLILTFLFRNRLNVLGFSIALFDIGIALSTFGLYYYCTKMKKKEILR